MQNCDLCLTEEECCIVEEVGFSMLFPPPVHPSRTLPNWYDLHSHSFHSARCSETLCLVPSMQTFGPATCLQVTSPNCKDVGYAHLCVCVNLNLTNGRVLAKELYSIAAPLYSCTYYSNVLWRMCANHKYALISDTAPLYMWVSVTRKLKWDACERLSTLRLAMLRPKFIGSASQQL